MTDIIIIPALKESVFWTTRGPDLYIYISGSFPYLVNGKKYSQRCGMAICYSCNKLVYLGIERLIMGERCVQYITDWKASLQLRNSDILLLMECIGVCINIGLVRLVPEKSFAN
jgi:hypothetical protein